MDDQNTQQVGQNPTIQPIQIPEKTKINYWIILTIVFMMLFLIAVSIILYTQTKKHGIDIPKLISQPTTTNQTISNKGKLTYLDMEGNQIVVDLDNDTNQTIPTKCKNEGDWRMGIWGTEYHWTADGENVVISCNSGNWYEYNILTKDLKTLGINGNDIAGDSWELQLSKDANSVFVTSEQKTWQIDLISGKRTELFPEKALRFSPDGTKVVIVRIAGKDELDNNVEKFSVLDIPTKKETEIIPPSNSKQNPFLFEFSFDSNGNTLVYAYDTNVLQNDRDPGAGTRRHIAFYDLSLKQSREISLPVPGATNPVFSPNDQYIYFEAEDPYDLKVHQSLWIMKISDGSTKKIFEGGGFYYFPDIPSWSSNSLYIATDTVGKDEINIINVNNGETKILTGNLPVFSPLRAAIK